uniref:C2H2-type domain-containing protein n=1 Tax=Angiostrongylus cantonensis TaxID=6313 RepID=A0A0K0DQ26_ANGCA
MVLFHIILPPLPYVSSGNKRLLDVMVELVVSDLYDKIANEQTGVRVDPEVFYECKHCPAFQISGSSLRDSDKGRAHAAAHRIAFEALLEPSPVLICPICDFALKTSGTACIFGCMFNDLDLVKHLEQDHVDVLADDVVCDFSDPRYLLTTFQEKQLSRSIPERYVMCGNEVLCCLSSDEVADVTDSDVDDGTTVDLSNDDNDAELNPCNNGESSHMFLSNGGSAMDEVNTNVERAHVEGESEDGISVIHWNQVVSDTNSNRTSNQKKRCEKLLLRRKMSGVSVVTCMVCQWSPPRVRDSMRIRDEVSKHDQRMLSCMDFSLEEYFEKEHLSDLSGTINSQIMERVYGELLAKLFGICIPLVYRILHGNNGNPFRRPDASRKKRKVIRFTRSKGRRENLKAIPLGKAGHISDRDLSIRFEAKESSDAGSCEQDCADLLVAGNFESDQHIQCARAECGHSLLALADRMAIVRHVAAHIRHDETRLLNRTGASSVVACDCGMAVGSAMGYIYHIVHDHVFEQKQFSDISATIIVETAIASVLSLRVDFRATKWPLWCAYFSLENDEGDENFFAGCTDLNERWLKLWEDFIEEHLTGKSMSPGDTIKLFEMHPFVDEQRLQSRKHKSVAIMDSKSLYRSLSMVWRRLDNWAYDPVHRAQLASESRWIRLAQIRRKVFLESNKDEYQNPDIWSGVTTGANFRNRRDFFGWKIGFCYVVLLAGAVQFLLKFPFENAECPNSSSGLVVIPSSANESDYQETTGVAELSGAVVRCSSCSNVCISAVDTAAIKNHCALHAAMEGRMLCSLYIHSAADRPLVCPFCHCEVNVYKPMKFLHHLQAKHMDKARIIYDRYLFHYFPQQK